MVIHEETDAKRLIFPKGGGTQNFDLTSHTFLGVIVQLQTHNLMALGQLSVDLMLVVGISG